ncbi:Response regulator receiver protein [Candidatus Sulfotelmatomonas gaucii]|uniref:Response regulator receiver protein n=1 Tax=Candidatus Sulfuritelmatomonas gaucii TaxID=2043161 RepID=A0A2N9LT81_9BACT|nr:Response regulator receiver protein [Candidatus Sulfotelmatomonas gaucii]
MEAARLRAYLVDDEPLATERLARMLAPYDFLEIAGSSTDPAKAVEFLSGASQESPGKRIDVLFLDIQMPGMNGFELLSRLSVQPFVIFTTAYDQYALRAFEVNSIDYLVKPIETEQLERALAKLGRLRPLIKPDWQLSPDLPAVLQDLAASLRSRHGDYPRHVASRVGDRISFLDLSSVTHFIARDKLTYAVSNGKEHSVDQTIAALEQKLDPARFLRIHRAILLNLDWVKQADISFAGRTVVSLKDARKTQLPVARDRVRVLRSRMGF